MPLPYSAVADPTHTPKSPGGGPVGFLRGAAYPFRGIVWLFKNRGAWPYAVLPALVNGLILLGLGLYAFSEFGTLYALIQPDWAEAANEGAAWYASAGRSALNALLGVITTVLLIGGTLLGGILIGAILAGPFHEKLSEVVERIATGRPPPDEPLSLRTLSKDGVRAVRSAVQRLTLFSLLYVPLFFLSLVPVVGLVGLAGTLIYSAFFLALNFTDPVLERRKLPLPRKVGWASDALAPWLGFGGALLLVMLVPLLQLVLAPALVTAGTLLYLDVEEGGSGTVSGTDEL